MKNKLEIGEAKSKVFKKFLEDHELSNEKLRKMLALLVESYCFIPEHPCPCSDYSEFSVCELQDGEEFDRDKCPVCLFVDFIGEIELEGGD